MRLTSAGPVNVFALQGVYNQGSTLDLQGSSGGYAISSGQTGSYQVDNAFNVNPAAWQSLQTGAAVVSTPAYLGYSFGTKKAWTATANPSERYFPGAVVRKQISTIKIQQSSDPQKRAMQLRIEASDDGLTWLRQDVVNVPNNAGLNVIQVRSHAAYNQWRIIPVFFGGLNSNSPWEVLQVHLLEQTQISLDNIEDFALLENRDRSYAQSSVLLKCQYDLLDVQTELAKFGINLPETYIFTVSFVQMVQILGRPVVIGDIIELPGEIQYDPKLYPVRKWLEVTDTAWATEGYTFNWKPNLFKFYGQPILPSVEHKDILGLPGVTVQQQPDSDILGPGFLENDQAYESNDVIAQMSKDLVPQTGHDPPDIQSGAPILGPRGGYDGNDLYSEDAIPPNGAAYTSGDSFPQGATVGQYHRLTYTNVPVALRPADKLCVFKDGRWRVIEVNTRGTPDSHKKTMSRMLGSGTKKFIPDSQI
jgi:hypothetical protein